MSGKKELTLKGAVSTSTSGVVCPQVWTNYPRGRFDFGRKLSIIILSTTLKYMHLRSDYSGMADLFGTNYPRGQGGQGQGRPL